MVLLSIVSRLLVQGQQMAFHHPIFLIFSLRPPEMRD